MRRAALDGAAGRDQRLSDHLAAEHALPAVLRAAPAKEIHLELLEVEHIEHGLDGGGHARTWAARGRDCQGERAQNETGPVRGRLDRRNAVSFYFFAQTRRALTARIRIGAAGRAVFGRGREHRSANAQRADHDLVAAAFGGRVVGDVDAEFALVAAVALRSGRALRSGIALGARDALRPALTLRSGRPRRSGFALGAGGALRAALALRTHGSGRSRRPGIALGAGHALRSADRPSDPPARPVRCRPSGRRRPWRLADLPRLARPGGLPAPWSSPRARVRLRPPALKSFALPPSI